MHSLWEKVKERAALAQARRDKQTNIQLAEHKRISGGCSNCDSDGDGKSEGWSEGKKATVTASIGCAVCGSYSHVSRSREDCPNV